MNRKQNWKRWNEEKKLTAKNYEQDEKEIKLLNWICIILKFTYYVAN